MQLRRPMHEHLSLVRETRTMDATLVFLRSEKRRKFEQEIARFDCRKFSRSAFDLLVERSSRRNSTGCKEV